MENNLKKLLSVERIDRSCNRSHGIWESDTHTIRITQKEGNWRKFGFVKNGITYVEPYEGLFLMEMNRLELYFNEVIVSLEQGYSLLLDSKYSISLDHYVVYSKLMRAGYFVQKFKDTYIEPKASNETLSVEIKNDESECVWKYLSCLLNNKTECDVPENVKHSIDAIAERTKSSKFVEEASNVGDVGGWNLKSTSVKRKFIDHSKSYQSYKKRRKTNQVVSSENDSKLHHIFNELNQVNIPLADVTCDSELNSRSCKLQFSFDLYFEDENGTKKTEINIPDRRILVLKYVFFSILFFLLHTNTAFFQNFRSSCR